MIGLTLSHSEISSAETGMPCDTFTPFTPGLLSDKEITWS